MGLVYKGLGVGQLCCPDGGVLDWNVKHCGLNAFVVQLVKC